MAVPHYFRIAIRHLLHRCYLAGPPCSGDWDGCGNCWDASNSIFDHADDRRLGDAAYVESYHFSQAMAVSLFHMQSGRMQRAFLFSCRGESISDGSSDGDWSGRPVPDCVNPASRCNKQFARRKSMDGHDSVRRIFDRRNTPLGFRSLLRHRRKLSSLLSHSNLHQSDSYRGIRILPQQAVHALIATIRRLLLSMEEQPSYCDYRTLTCPIHLCPHRYPSLLQAVPSKHQVHHVACSESLPMSRHQYVRFPRWQRLGSISVDCNDYGR